ncbi:MAG: DUF4491 family protein [Chloroflexota bacterium]
MQLNYIGIIAALTAFLSIWIGHVSVRKIEAASRTIWLPTVIAVGLGLMLEYWSLVTDYRLLSTTLGILGITLLWDALEFTRQQRRVRKGHAPANPRNPRHVKIMAEYPSATTVDLLKKPAAH